MSTIEYPNQPTPRAEIAGVPVFCVHDILEDIAKIKPNPKNPNKHPEEQIKLLAYIIERQGWRAPITISKQSGLIVKGEGRYRAALLMGQPQVPVDYQDYADEDTELADLLADNKLAELSQIDNDLLAELFHGLDPDGEIELTGFTMEEYESIIQSLDAQMQEANALDLGGDKLSADALDLEREKQPVTKDKITSCHCPKCGCVFGVEL